MRIRADSVVVSSVLHTIALLSFVRAALWNYFSGNNKALLAQMDAGFRAVAQTEHYLGVCLFALILVGLIVTWTGYVKMRRSAWLVIFVIAWIGVFPLFVLPFVSPLLHGRLELTFFEFLYHAISSRGLPREYLESILMFSAMLIGLLLPIKKFFGRGEVERQRHRPSARVIGFSLVGLLLVSIAFYAWIRVGALYEISAQQQTVWFVAPPPPPPPPSTPSNCPDGN